jgi:peptidoglycan hydrolase-like protein with peptidoglycan-binding domain
LRLSRGDGRAEAAWVLVTGHTLAVDGVFGQRTAIWVAAFQYVAGLNPDGVVGTLTWRALVTESLAG